MPEQNYVEDEIDLRDYIKVILKRKKLILTVFFVAVITATIVSFLMPKIYETTSKIQLGKVDELLISKEEAKNILLSQKLLIPIIQQLQLDVKKLDLDTKLKQFKKNIKIEDIKDTDLLEIKTQYPDAEIAVKINKAIADSFLIQQQDIYKKRISLTVEQIKELEAAIKSVEENIKMTQNLVTELSLSTGISQPEIGLRIILLQNTLSDYEGNLNALRNQKYGLENLLSKAKEFKIVEEPLKPKYPIKPKKKLNVALSGVISLVLGVFLAFFLEFWQKGTS